MLISNSTGRRNANCSRIARRRITAVVTSRHSSREKFKICWRATKMKRPCLNFEKKLQAASYEIFCLKICQLLTHIIMSIVFDCLSNLAPLTLIYGAKQVGMDYEWPLFGMKMSDAKIFSECLKMTQSLVYLSLPGNLIDDDLITILIKGLVLNKTIS